jgi:hypothetical protein
MTIAGNYDRLETSLGIAGPGRTNIHNGGIQVEYGVPMRPGDVITSVTYLAEYKERPGSLGLMLFATSRTVWTNQDDAMVKTTLSTLIRY